MRRAFPLLLVLWAAGCGSAPAGAVSPPGSSPSAAGSLVAGMGAMSVSAAVAAHAGGSIRGSIAVRGYWSHLDIAIPCASDATRTGALEMGCGDDLYGITERDEPAAVFDKSANSNAFYYRPASGPLIHPFIEGTALEETLFASVFGPAPTYGIVQGPVPITVVGHFDDPRAADCQPARRQECLDRLVIEQVVFLGSQPAPSATSASQTQADRETARSLVTRYVRDLVVGDFAAAWALLAEPSRVGYASFADYASERAAYVTGAGPGFTMVVEPDLAVGIADWFENLSAVELDQAHAVTVEVDWRAYSKDRNNAGYEIYVAAPDGGGTWRVWKAR